MKILKLAFNPKVLERKPVESYDICAQKVIKAVQKNTVVDKPSFSRVLYLLGDSFESTGNRTQMNNKSKWFAEKLVSLKSNDLAGIVYSLLIKLNYDSPKLREEFATRALANAVRIKDPIHIMARANDLKEVYKITAHGSDKHLKVLYQEKRALNDIINNYDKLQKSHTTISRDLKPLEGYQLKLAAIKVEIAELLLKKDPTLAKKELLESQEMYTILGGGKNFEKINQLLQNLG